MRCSRCHNVAYCGAQHQKDHWRTHKPACTLNARPTIPSSPFPSSDILDPAATVSKLAAEDRGPYSDLMQGVTTMTPATMMSALTPFSESLSKDETYQRLIDAFRLWCDDLYAFQGDHIGLYAQDDPYPEFVRFVKKARKHLPSWWTNADDKAVLKMSTTHDHFNLQYAVEKSDINEHYGSSMFAMGLRMWTEKVTGRRSG
ncbi:uncharacterized protein RHOBADRAFT_43049 [Rhodotorula graminis WP1]|uniref:MYND-type domain-containing protein n=1 Tax=Rhodotorula graminis (strain WP1) TaxID=578459 RepID=A0A194S4W4_RHOGW|nr:uncharacterized protein RHOBADRAFT_43049 [Rhodotorula graminis WP1]KPV75627.1 hypothetical protein RHOBADRAFT_43049 [Rhodotorula graminis WP1]